MDALSLLEYSLDNKAQGITCRNKAQFKERYLADSLYIMKNMVYMEYCDAYGIGESDTTYLLFPKNMDTTHEAIISRASCVAPPVKQE